MNSSPVPRILHVTLLCVGFAIASVAAQSDAPEIEAPQETAVKRVADTSANAIADTVKRAPQAAAKRDSLHQSAVPTTAAPAVSDSNELVIEVDQNQSRNHDKSLPLAMLMSAVLPGTGEYYLKEKSPAKTFLLVEAGFWASLYVAFVSKDSYLQSARNYASEFAGIDASNKSESFLETMGTYREYRETEHRQDSYELAQVLSGKRDGKYDIAATPDNYWDFGSSSNPQNTRNWKTFQSTLRYYRASKVAVSFAFGALALNRLASVANTLHVYKKTSARGLSLNVAPELGPDFSGARLTVNF